MNEVEHILPCRNLLGEGPVWSVEERRLYWVDIDGHSYSRFQPDSGAYEIEQVGIQVGVLALRASGGIVMAVRDGFALWDERKQELSYLARPFNNPTLRFNDGAVDSAGRFWAGTMRIGQGDQALGVLYRLDPDGTVHEMEHNIGISNGIGWSPDDTIMYFTDTALKIIYAYDFDSGTGTISNRRVFVDSTAEIGSPDGLAVDAHGYIWSARWDGAKIVRYAPDGTVEREVSVPALRPSSCVFGGENLDELYITSAAVNASDQEKYPLSGDLFRLKTGIKGLPKHKFAG